MFALKYRSAIAADSAAESMPPNRQRCLAACAAWRAHWQPIFAKEAAACRRPEVPPAPPSSSPPPTVDAKGSGELFRRLQAARLRLVRFFTFTDVEWQEWVADADAMSCAFPGAREWSAALGDARRLHALNCIGTEPGAGSGLSLLADAVEHGDSLTLDDAARSAMRIAIAATGGWVDYASAPHKIVVEHLTAAHDACMAALTDAEDAGEVVDGPAAEMRVLSRKLEAEVRAAYRSLLSTLHFGIHEATEEYEKWEPSDVPKLMSVSAATTSATFDVERLQKYKAVADAVTTGGTAAVDAAVSAWQALVSFEMAIATSAVSSSSAERSEQDGKRALGVASAIERSIGCAARAVSWLVTDHTSVDRANAACVFLKRMTSIILEAVLIMSRPAGSGRRPDVNLSHGLAAFLGSPCAGLSWVARQAASIAAWYPTKVAPEALAVIADAVQGLVLLGVAHSGDAGATSDGADPIKEAMELLSFHFAAQQHYDPVLTLVQQQSGESTATTTTAAETTPRLLEMRAIALARASLALKCATTMSQLGGPSVCPPDVVIATFEVVATVGATLQDDLLCSDACAVWCAAVKYDATALNESRRHWRSMLSVARGGERGASSFASASDVRRIAAQWCAVERVACAASVPEASVAFVFEANKASQRAIHFAEVGERRRCAAAGAHVEERRQQSGGCPPPMGDAAATQPERPQPTAEAAGGARTTGDTSINVVHVSRIKAECSTEERIRKAAVKAVDGAADDVAVVNVVRGGTPQAFAFVVYRTPDLATAALRADAVETHWRVLLGPKTVVVPSRPKPSTVNNVTTAEAAPMGPTANVDFNDMLLAGR